MKDLHEALVQQKPNSSSSSNLNNAPLPRPTGTTETTETRARAGSDLGNLVDDVVEDTVATANTTELVGGDNANAELNEVDALIRSVER